MSRSPIVSIIPTAIVNTMAANTQRGRYCSGPVKASSTCKYLLRELAARARAIRHGGLRRAAVDHERPAHGGGDIRGRSNPAAGGIRAAL
jgi:hypothetical protein